MGNQDIGHEETTTARAALKKPIALSLPQRKRSDDAAQPVPILNKQKNRGVREYRGELETRTGLSPPQRKASATGDDEVNTPPTSNKSRIRDLWLNQEKCSEIIEEPSPRSAMKPPERTSS